MEGPRPCTADEKEKKGRKGKKKVGFGKIPDPTRDARHSPGDIVTTCEKEKKKKKKKISWLTGSPAALCCDVNSCFDFGFKVWFFGCRLTLTPASGSRPPGMQRFQPHPVSTFDWFDSRSEQEHQPPCLHHSHVESLHGPCMCGAKLNAEAAGATLWLISSHLIPSHLISLAAGHD